jgi:hypothetical protein
MSSRVYTPKNIKMLPIHKAQIQWTHRVTDHRLCRWPQIMSCDWPQIMSCDWPQIMSLTTDYVVWLTTYYVVLWRDVS